MLLYFDINSAKNPYINYAVVGGTILANLIVPFTNIYGMSLQFLQIMLLALMDTPKMDENLELTL